MQDVWKLDTTSDLFGLFELSISPDLQVKNFHRSDVLDILVPPKTRGYGTSCGSSLLGNISPDGKNIIVYLANSDCSHWETNLLNLETMTFSKVITGLNPTLGTVQWLP